MPNKIINLSKLDGIWIGSHMLYFRCDKEKHLGWRCGGDAGYLLIQEGELSGRRFSLHLCEAHARPYMSFLEKENDGSFGDPE